MSSADEASKAMLAAALGGLLGLGGAGCVPKWEGGTTGSSAGGASTASSSNNGGSTSDGGSATGGGGSGAGGNGAGGSTTASGGGGDGGGGGTPTNPHTPIPNTECASGQVPNPMVTSSTMMVMTEQQFKDLCSQHMGIFEVQPLCGGSNACRGIAYDSGTGILTEHTCKGTNTCAGYNCVICN
jgi:hypothetical protein